MDSREIAKMIREETIDINNQESFFSSLIKGFLLKVTEDIKIRDEIVPHIILSTGDDIMYLNLKGQDQSIEPFQISNENYVYNTIPRCIVNPTNIDLSSDQITSPCSRGILQYEYNDIIYTYSGEFRRYPVKLNCDLKYYIDSYKDLLFLCQQIITKLSFIRVYKITYLGQVINCSYRLPDTFSPEHLIEIEGNTTDLKNKTLDISLEIESNIPVYTPQTIVPVDQYIINTEVNIVEKNEIK